MWQTCPHCPPRPLTRIHRGQWMRLLPFSALLECRLCERRYLRVLFVTLRLSPLRRPGGGS
jgi:hypothetical protein